jgi:ribosome maturation factor RimP
MSSTQSSLHGVDRAALLRVVEPIVRAHGGELVDLEFRPERGGWVLRLYVEREGSAERNLSTREAAVSLELCAEVSRDLSPALDVADLVPHAYQLEVSSPGVERPLRGERDFVRFSGEKAKLKLREAIPTAGDPGAEKRTSQRVFVGTIEGVTDGNVRIREGTRTHDVPLSLVESARLVFEFGASASQGRHPKRAGHKSNRGESEAAPGRAPLAKRH